MKTYSVYILYSEKLDRFYTGTSVDVERRVEEHNTGVYGDSFTRKGIPWVLYLRMDDLESGQAYAIERHIKSMKSRKFIQDLAKYEDLRRRLRDRYGSQVQPR